MMQRYFGLLMPNFAQEPAQSDSAVQSKLGTAATGTDHVKIAIQANMQTDSQVNGAVEKLIGRLGEHGYGDIYVDQPSKERLAVTRIIAQQGNDDEARAIQQALGFGDVLVESTGNLESDVTIRLGSDALTGLASPLPQTTPSSEATTLPSGSLPESAPVSSPAAQPVTPQDKGLPKTAPARLEPGLDPN